jgi:hypothetical protein
MFGGNGMSTDANKPIKDVGFIERMCVVAISFAAALPLANFVEKRTGNDAATFATLITGGLVMSKGFTTLLRKLANRPEQESRGR